MDRQLVAIIDDDERLRTSIARLVESFGLRARTWGSGEDYLSDPDGRDAGCVITDVQMPGMDGLELQRAVSEMVPAPAVIVMTAYPRGDVEAKALAAGAAHFLVKPFDAESLEQALRDVLQ